MTGYMLVRTYDAMRRLGLTRSQPDFSRRWCGRGKTYLRDYVLREGREDARVSPETVAMLRSQLRALAARMPAGLRGEVEDIIDRVEQGNAIANLLTRR